MVVVDGQGDPLGGTITSASPSEVRLAEDTLETIKVPRPSSGRPKSRPKRLIGDKAYDSDKLRASLAGKGIRLLVPYRKNRKKKKNVARSRGALPTSVENRADLRLAGQLPQTGCPL
jgi:hypothetical protein